MVISANESRPSVTVLLASFNRLELLKAAVASALNQQYPACQVVIVDDGSDDETLEWLRQQETAVSRLSVCYRQHKGVAAARAFGVEQSDDEYILILDSDDTLVPDAIDTMMQALQSTQDAQIAFSDIREITPDGAATVRQYRQYPSPGAMLLATMIRPRVPFKHSGTLFRRETALALGSYDAALTCKVDIDLFLKFMRAGYLPLHVGKPVVDFRMHKDSVSINRMQGIKVWMYLIDEYGPSGFASRLLIKIVRVGAELMKRLYVELLRKA